MSVCQYVRMSICRYVRMQLFSLGIKIKVVPKVIMMSEKPTLVLLKPCFDIEIII